MSESGDFVTDVLPHVTRCAVRWLPDRVEDVQTLAWLLWRKRPDVRPGTLARFAIRSLRTHDVNQIGFGHGHAYHALAWVRITLMGDYDGRDPAPGPARLAELRERWARWWSCLTSRERSLVWAVQQGFVGRELAQAVGVKKTWLSTLRGRLRRKWARCA